jgi:hypothetical protein
VGLMSLDPNGNTLISVQTSILVNRRELCEVDPENWTGC